MSERALNEHLKSRTKSASKRAIQKPSEGPGCESLVSSPVYASLEIAEGNEGDVCPTKSGPAVSPCPLPLSR
eukprot:9468752-Pyramimonas_sp.AAC.1